MVPSIVYGRPINHWLCYARLPIIFGARLYILKLDEVKVRPVPFGLLINPGEVIDE